MSVTRTSESIVKRPVVSEKSYALMSEGRYVFRCDPSANKIEIARAVEELFADSKINVVDVNVINVRGKGRTRGARGSRRRIHGASPDWKKAIVTLAAGQKIEGLFEGV